MSKVNPFGSFWSNPSDISHRNDAILERVALPVPKTHAMSDVSGQGFLSPHFCFSTAELKTFLRLSRAAVDDSISQSLSGLTLPAQGDADSVRTAQRIPTSQHINSESCRSFQNLVLFPSWKFRTSVLDYCAVVAASPDPNDPGRFLRAAEARERREHVIDERLDPYSARYFPRETRTQCLANLVRQERAIEEIVRHRTWSVMQDRCHSSRSSWQDAMKNFEDKYRGAIKARASVESGP